MELRHLRYFVAVAETLSFTQAAADRAVAQSALSQQIARLEKDVGASLFTRSSRHVQLTEAGAVLLPWARRLLSDAEQARQDVQALSGLRRGSLRLGMTRAVAGGLDLAAVLAEFSADYPGIELSIGHDTNKALLAALLAGEFDLVFTDLSPEQMQAGAGMPTGLGHRVLRQDRLVAVLSAGHRLAHRGHVDLAELSDDEFIWPDKGTGLRAAVEAACARAGVTPRQNLEVGLVGEMVQLAAHGLGVAVVPSAAVAVAVAAAAAAAEPGAAASAGARVLRVTDPQAVHSVLLVHPADRLSAAATALIGVIDRRSGAAKHHAS
jgi:DNA-binding transcriptional LysR family regulator